MAKKKLESTLLNMILSLTIISVGMSAALGFVYVQTKAPIEIGSKKKVVNAIKDVLPEFNNDPLAEIDTVNGLEFYPGKKDGELIGYAVKTFTMQGFSGLISLMVGLLPDGTINKIQVLEQKETPGLGTKMTEPSFMNQFLGKNPAEFRLVVKQDGGEIDAITASTITSRAFCDALQRAYDALQLKNSGVTGKPAINDSVNINNIIKTVAGEFSNNPEAEKQLITEVGINAELYPVKSGDQLISTCVVSSSQKGYYGEIKLMTCFDINGLISSVTVLKQNETKNIGSKVADSAFLCQFNGVDPAKFNFEPKTKGGKLDAVAGATISSSACADAIISAYNAYKKGVIK